MIRKLLSTVLNRNFILYGIIGMSGALIDLIFYIVFYKLLHINPAIASFLSVSLGIINNFVLNSRYNFKKHDRMWFRFANFYAVGIGGAVLSSVLIVILLNGLGFSPIVSKLLTIVPVVILQFFLNKRFSFNDLNDAPLHNHPVHRLLTYHRPILAVLVVFMMISTAIIHQLPLGYPAGGPDENIHYRFDVSFMIQHHRLPVSGKDDIQALSDCHNDPFNHVPCLYSYQAYPGATYAVTAAGAWFIHQLTGTGYLTAARIMSLLYGLIFLTLIYLTSRRITKHNTIAAAITAGVGLIPQVIFCFSYVNPDAPSLAIAAFVVYALTRFVRNRTKLDIGLAGLAIGGLLPLAKYNYLVLLPTVVVLLGYLIYSKRIDLAAVGKLLAWSAGWFLLLASFWYVRNLVLYHDLTGQGFVLKQMAKYHQLGAVHPLLSFDTISAFNQHDFFGLTFKSFFLAFGYLHFFAPGLLYVAVAVLIIAALAAVGSIVASDRQDLRHKALIAIGGLIVLFLAAFVLVYINSARYDFQPQGRYLYVALPFVASTLAYLYSLQKKYKNLIYLGLVSNGLLFIAMLSLMLGGKV